MSALYGRRLLSFCLLTVLPAGAALSQVLIPPSGYVKQDFDAMGTGTALPAGWRVNDPGVAGNTSLSYSSPGAITTMNQVADAGTPTLGGRYNWGTSGGTDRAVGFMATASYPAPNAVLVQYRNTTGATVTSVTLTFRLERYRVNTDAFSLSLYSSTTGSANSWTAQTGGEVSTAVFPTGTSAYSFTTSGTIYKTATITGLNIANNDDLYFMWSFRSTGSNGQGIGLDDVVLQAGTGSPNVSAALQDNLSQDVNSNGAVNTGDKVTYKATIRANGNSTPTGVVYNNPAPANTTQSGSVRTSPLALDDNYSLPTGNSLAVAAGTGVLANDIGAPAPTVASFGNSVSTGSTVANGINSATTDNGGSVVMGADGSFTYTTPAGFAGYDRFGYTAANGNMPNNDAIVTVAVGTPPSAVNDILYNVTGNIRISVPAASGVLGNDAGTNRMVVAAGPTAGNTTAANLGVNFTAANGGTVNIAADGSFTYTPAAGQTGSDQFYYTIDNGFAAPSTALCSLSISGMIWFVDANAAVNGDGRLTSPYNNLTSFMAVNGGAGLTQPKAGHAIFLYESNTPYNAGANGFSLLNNQVLIGQDASASIVTLTGISLAANSSPLPVTDPGNATKVTLSGSNNGIVLGSAKNGKVYGLTINTTGGAAISADFAGTLTLSPGTLAQPADVTVNASGGYAIVSNGTAGVTTLNGALVSTSATNGTNYVQLYSCGGSLNLGNGNMSGAAGTGFLVSGGSISLTYSGNMSMPAASGSPAVIASGGHTGTLTFNTGTLTVPGGTGLQFNDADGAYNFNGTTMLNGGDAGIDILNGSGGTFTFGTGTTITSPTNAAFNIGINPQAANPVASTATVTYSGSITQNNNAEAVSITGGHTGTVTFQTGNITAGNGSGLQFNNADGTYNFSGVITLANGDAGIDIIGGSGGTFNFSNSGSSITNPSGVAFQVGQSGSANSGGNGNITYNGTISKTSTGRAVDVQNRNGGILTFGGSVSSTNGSGGVQLQTNTGATINFNGGLTLSTDGNVALLGSSGGTLNITGTGNTITTTSGQGISLNGVNAGAGGINFASVISNGTGAVNTGGIVAAILNSTGTKNLGRVSTATVSNALSVTNAGTVIVGAAGNASTLTTSGVAVGLAINSTDLQLTGLGLDINCTGSGVGVNCSGGTVNITGGNLDITTNTGNGFNATAGVVSLTGSNNTINSTSATALNVTTTIGNSGLNFRSISAGNNTAVADPVNGIVLNNTGSGTVTVSGNLSANSGGTIQSTTGLGISITGTANANLSYMLVRNSGSHGMNVTGPSGVTLNGCRLETNGNGDDENSLNLLNASGAILIDNTTFFGAAENLIRVDNSNANLNLTIQNSQFEYPNPKNSAFANSAILITPKGSSSVTASVKGNTFKNIPVASFQFGPDGTATGTGNAVFSNNNISVDAGLNVTCASNSECRTGLVSVGGTGGTTLFTAAHNTFTRVNGDGVFIMGANQSSTLKARVDSNSISNAIDDAFVIGLGQNATEVLSFDGNIINTIGGDAFEVASGDPNNAFGGSMNLTIKNSNIINPGQTPSLVGSGGIGIFNFGGINHTMCLTLTNNTVTNNTTGLDIYLEGNFSNLGSTTILQTTGTGAATAADIKNMNPAVNLANIAVNAVNRSNGAACQTPGL